MRTELDFSPPALTPAHDTSLVGLLIDGMKDGIQERFAEIVRSPQAIVGAVALPGFVGMVLPQLPHDPTTVRAALVVGAVFGAIALLDWSCRGVRTAQALRTVYRDPSEYQRQRRVIAHELGYAMVDYGLGVGSGYCGMRLSAVRSPLELSPRNMVRLLEAEGNKAAQYTGPRPVPMITQHRNGSLRAGLGLSGEESANIALGARDAIVRIHTGNGRGTGFFVTDAGLIATNNHVISGANSYHVRTTRGWFNARLVARDKSADLALLQIIDRPQGRTFSFLERAATAVDSQPTGGLGKPLTSGERALVIGHPLAADPVVMSVGSTSKVAARFQSQSRGPLQRSSLPGTEGGQMPGSTRGALLWEMETDVPVLPGSSGSPMLNMEGKVVGVMKTAYPDTHAGGAIAVQHLNALIDAAANTPPRLGWLSVRSSALNATEQTVSAFSVKRVERAQLATRMHEILPAPRIHHPRVHLGPTALGTALVPSLIGSVVREPMLESLGAAQLGSSR